MMPQRLTARARFSQPVRFLLALTLAVWAGLVVCPASAMAESGWLPWEPLWSLPSVQSPGLFIALDPVTGRPTRPSEAQRRALAAQLESEDALLAPLSPLIIERLPGGGEVVHLGGRFQVYSVARRDTKGRIVTDCSLDPTAARKLLSAPVPARAVPREEK